MKINTEPQRGQFTYFCKYWKGFGNFSVIDLKGVFAYSGYIVLNFELIFF